jgi:predicted kinase
VLIAFGGLPGTGKTTLARTVASRYASVYLRIDTIEQAIQDSDVLRAKSIVEVQDELMRELVKARHSLK